jgi:hypothetical protein
LAPGHPGRHDIFYPAHRLPGLPYFGAVLESPDIPPSLAWPPHAPPEISPILHHGHYLMTGWRACAEICGTWDAPSLWLSCREMQLLSAGLIMHTAILHLFYNSFTCT